MYVAFLQETQACLSWVGRSFDYAYTAGIQWNGWVGFIWSHIFNPPHRIIQFHIQALSTILTCRVLACERCGMHVFYVEPHNLTKTLLTTHLHLREVHPLPDQPE